MNKPILKIPIRHAIYKDKDTDTDKNTNKDIINKTINKDKKNESENENENDKIETETDFEDSTKLVITSNNNVINKSTNPDKKVLNVIKKPIIKNKSINNPASSISNTGIFLSACDKITGSTTNVNNIIDDNFTMWMQKIDREKYTNRIIASFDVGIKHLAYCVMTITDNNEFYIFDWGVINLIDIVENDRMCEFKNSKTNKCCEKKASFVVNDTLYLCGIHAKNYKETCNPIQKSTNIKTEDIPIQTLCLNMVKKLDECPIFLTVDDILIEQQPAFGSSRPNPFGKGKGNGGPGVHPRMKNLSYMIYSYFIIKGVSQQTIQNVKFISSNNKLKVYNGPPILLTQKSQYTKNKIMAQLHLKYILKDQIQLLNFFDTYKKKDDLADCFLQGAWYLTKGINTN